MPLGAIGDSLKDKLKDFYNPFKNKFIDPGLYSINGKNGIYDCYFNDKKGWGYKFQINCEQVPFPKGVIPKSGNVDILSIDNQKQSKKIKPFPNLFQKLVDYIPDSMNLKNKKTKNLIKNISHH